MNHPFQISSVSIVIPVYNEEDNVQILHQKISKALFPMDLDYEVIFVDDGSTDDTYEVLKKIYNADPRVKAIKLRKKYGQSCALRRGFDFVFGQVVVCIDGDLQNDPNDIPRLLKTMEQGFDFVNGWRYNRIDSLFRKLLSKIANMLISYKTGIPLNDYGCALMAVKVDIIKKMKIYGANARFIKPLIVSLASSVCEVKIAHYARRGGVSKYTVLEIIKKGLDFLLHFQNKEDLSQNSPCRIVAIHR